MKNTAFEIHMFLGQGRIIENSKYPVGEIHAFIFYFRQSKGSDYQLIYAEEKINEAGMDQIEFSKVGILDPSRINDKNRDPYERALDKGSSIIIYSERI